MKSSIPDRQIREWAYRKTCGNQKGQRRLLKELFDKHAETRGWLFQDERKFIEHHLVTRNYYTHRSSDRSSKIKPYEGENLYWHTEGLILLCYSIVANMLGFPQAEVIDLIGKSRLKDHSIRCAKELYAGD